MLTIIIIISTDTVTESKAMLSINASTIHSEIFINIIDFPLNPMQPDYNTDKESKHH
jgi:hypothetical protein